MRNENLCTSISGTHIQAWFINDSKIYPQAALTCPTLAYHKEFGEPIMRTH